VSTFLRERNILKITERGRELVASPEFAAAVIKFMQDWDGPHEEGAEHVCRIICLTLCEVDYEQGPELDSPEFERFIDEHQREIGAAVASTGCVEILNAMSQRVVHQRALILINFIGVSARLLIDRSRALVLTLVQFVKTRIYSPSSSPRTPVTKNGG
jgi:hypothetical protein